MTKKKLKFFWFRSRNQKYAEQKKNKKNEFFTSPEDRMYITLFGIIVFSIKWKTNLFVTNQKNSDQNNYPIIKHSSFCKGNKKWEFSQTTIKEKHFSII